jgi:hypothetical protein
MIGIKKQIAHWRDGAEEDDSREIVEIARREGAIVEI